MIPADWESARGTEQFLVGGSTARGLDLRRGDLSNIRLEMVDASGADFREADLDDFRAVDCTFEGANFVGAAVRGARFFDCVLSSANFGACLLDGTTLSACMLIQTNLAEASLEGADLLGSAFSRARLMNARLRRARAKQALFDDADLTGADLRDGNFEKAYFLGANLTNVRWDGANLSDAQFDPGTGQRMLDDSLRMNPGHDSSLYAAFECTEGDKLWHVIERRGSSTNRLRIDHLALAGEFLEVDFERVDESVPLFVSYALIERVLLRDFLANEWQAHAKRLRFREKRSSTTLDLPG